jgi:hypothetical protein
MKCTEAFATCEPIYEEVSGWKDSTVGLREYNELPPNAKAYVKRIEEVVVCPIDIISTKLCGHHRSAPSVCIVERSVNIRAKLHTRPLGLPWVQTPKPQPQLIDKRALRTYIFPTTYL